MILPGWLTVHVVGYGLASGIILGGGAYALHEHDAKIRAEDKAIAARDADTLRTRLMQDALNRASARIETVTVALKPIIQRTQTIIDSARRRPTDTALVSRALNLADTSSRKCVDAIQSCDAFRKMAKDSMATLAVLLQRRDNEAIKAHAPPPAPHFSRGLQLGAGVCLDPTKPIRGTPCVSLTYGFHLRIF